MKAIALLLAAISVVIVNVRAQDLAPAYPPQLAGPAITLFNGKDLTGLKLVMKDAGADPAATWYITNGVIHCVGKPQSYIRTEQTYSNYFLTVEWRFVKIAPKADNSGVLVHMQTPDKVWPPCVQVQGKHTRMGDLILMAGAESKEHKGMDANTAVPFHKEYQDAEKPAGEWNKFDTICRGSTVQSFINGKYANQTTECTVTAGAIGVQCEGAELEIKSMVLTPLK